MTFLFLICFPDTGLILLILTYRKTTPTLTPTVVLISALWPSCAPTTPSLPDNMLNFVPTPPRLPNIGEDGLFLPYKGGLCYAGSFLKDILRKNIHFFVKHIFSFIVIIGLFMCNFSNLQYHINIIRSLFTCKCFKMNCNE